jgi:excisionase family DNA binding protein
MQPPTCIQTAEQNESMPSNRQPCRGRRPMRTQGQAVDERQRGRGSEPGRDVTNDQGAAESRQSDMSPTRSRAIERIVYTPLEVAYMLGVSKTTIYRWMDTGAIPCVQMGDNSRKLIPKAPFLNKFGLPSDR